MEVYSGEQRQLGLGPAGAQLRFGPIQVGFDLLLQRLEGGQKVGVNAVLAQLLNISGHVLMGLIKFLVKGCLGPVGNGAQGGDGAAAGLDLVIGLALIFSGGGVGVLGVPA